MTRRRGCSLATGARRSRTSFSTWRAAAAKPRARPRNERARRPGADACAAPHRRHGLALSLSPALVVVARARADLLAGRAAPGLGLSTVLHRAEFRFLR